MYNFQKGFKDKAKDDDADEKLNNLCQRKINQTD